MPFSRLYNPSLPLGIDPPPFTLLSTSIFDELGLCFRATTCAWLRADHQQHTSLSSISGPFFQQKSKEPGTQGCCSAARTPRCDETELQHLHLVSWVAVLLAGYSMLLFSREDIEVLVVLRHLTCWNPMTLQDRSPL